MEPGGLLLHSQELSNNPYPEPNQTDSSYWCIFLRSILILSSHLHLGLPKGLFPAGKQQILKSLLPSSILTTWPIYINLLDLITLNMLGKRYKLLSSLLWSLAHSPFSSFLGPNIGFRILLPNTIILHSKVYSFQFSPLIIWLVYVVITDR